MTVGEETLNTPVYVQVDSTRCHVMCDVTARYTLIGQPCGGGSRAAKLLRIAAFAPSTYTSVATDYNLRVYCVDDTIDAIQVRSLWPPCVADADIIFLPCGFFYLFFLSSPNLSRRRVDVYHTCIHDVALVQI